MLHATIGRRSPVTDSKAETKTLHTPHSGAFWSLSTVAASLVRTEAGCLLSLTSHGNKGVQS